MASLGSHLRQLTIAVVLLVYSASALSQPQVSVGPVPGALLLAQQRFEPGVQRLLAKRSLDALPIANGALFYIVPAALDPWAQRDQIRYLEYLLDKRALQDAVDQAGSDRQ